MLWVWPQRSTEPAQAPGSFLGLPPPCTGLHSPSLLLPPDLFGQPRCTLGNGFDFRFDKNKNKLGRPRRSWPSHPHPSPRAPESQRPCLSAGAWQEGGGRHGNHAGLRLAPGEEAALRACWGAGRCPSTWSLFSVGPGRCEGPWPGGFLETLPLASGLLRAPG